MSDLKLLESRLITRDSAIGGSSLTKCVLKLQQYFINYNLNNENEINLLRENYCREILLYKIEMEKFKETFEMCEQEIKGLFIC